MNTTNLVSTDIGPFTRTNRVFVVRFFRPSNGKWLAGILETLKLDDRVCSFRFRYFVEIRHWCEVDPTVSGDAILANFHLVIGDATSVGVDGMDRRPYRLAEPSRVINEHDSDGTLTVWSKDGAAVFSSRPNDVSEVRRLIETASPNKLLMEQLIISS